MRNLKRVLTLVMAVAMMMSLLVVGASATGFPDQDKIENTDAVNMNVALGIIKGRDTGVFDPTGNVTRAEMAKMICVALNGGKEPTLGTKATASYTDTKGHWAEAYIEYCTTLGIVAGMGDGTFAPNANVTGTQAAKMLLVCLGYDAVKENFNGANWSININVRASQKGLYDDLTIDPNAPLNRDDAAQVVYNALDAVKVEYEYKLTTVNGALTTTAVLKDMTGDKNTILKDKFDAKTKYTYLLGMNYDSKKKEYNYSHDSNGALPYAIDADDQLTGISLKSKNDYSELFGQKVKVIYKNNTAKDVYGIFAHKDMKVLATGVVGDIGTIKSDSFKFDGVVYKTDTTSATTEIYEFRNDTANWAGLNSLGNVNAIPAAIEPYTMKLIDADNDGKVDYLVAVPFNVAKVTFVGSTSVTAGNVSYKFADHDIASDIKKDDYAIITPAVNNAKDEAVLVKANKITGAIKGIESATKIKLDDTVYVADAGYTPPSFAMNDTFELVVVNGYFFNASKKSTAATNNNVGLVTAQASTLNSINNTLDVKILKADGTSSIVKVEKVNTTAGGVLANVAANNNNASIDAGEVFIGQIYTYEINSDGYYELSMFVAADYDAYATETSVTAGVADAAAIANIKDGKISITAAPGAGNSGTYYFEDGAVVFYHNGTEYKVTSGASANKWADIGASTGIIYANKASGYNKAEVALLNLGLAPDAGNTSYGWVTSNPFLVKDGSDYFLQLKVWNGEKEVTVLAKDFKNTATGVETAGFANVGSSTDASSLANLRKGCPVSFIDDGSGKISKLQGFKAAQYAVTAYADGKTDVVLNATPAGGTTNTVTIENDTKLIFVDTVNNTGVIGGSITIANEPVSGVYVANCYVIANNANEIKVIIVDTVNKVDGLASTLTIAGSATDGIGARGTKIGATAPSAANVTAMFTNAVGATVGATTAVVYAQDGTAYTYTIVTPFNTVAVTQADLTTALNLGANSTGAQIKAAADTLLTTANGVTSYTTTITAGGSGALVDGTTYVADLTLTFTITCANGETVTIAGVTADVTP